VYGFSNAILAAIDFATGKMLWQHRSVGKGSVTYADDRLYLLSEDNVVA
jgi:outer membrane protein assembly factor BamB